MAPLRFLSNGTKRTIKQSTNCGFVSSIYTKIAEIESGLIKAALCTIVATRGSSPRKTGAKMLVYQNSKIYGSIGGGALEKEIINHAIEVIKSNKAKVVKHNLVSDLAMCCGGTVEIFIEPIMNKKKLYIFGAGHIGKALAAFASNLDFQVHLIDERYELFDDVDLPESLKWREHHASAIEKLPFDENSFIVIVTHNHAYDREILALVAKKPHQYIGMIGSDRKVEVAKRNLVGSNLLSNEEINKIDMPIGIDINAITPQEIAISILAKLIDVRNNKLN